MVEASLIEIPPEPKLEPEPAPRTQEMRTTSQRARQVRNQNAVRQVSQAARFEEVANVVEPAASSTPASVPLATAGGSADAPASATRPGMHVRAKAAGVIVPTHPISVDNEENPPDPDQPGQGLGGWLQEYSDPCHYDLRLGESAVWYHKCGNAPVFTQPPNPWCYNAALEVGIEGSCEWDFDRALAAFRRKDYADAFARFKQLAEHRYAPAQSNLAAMYEDGLGVPQSDEMAAFWYGKAAAEGNAKGIYNLALMYHDGRAVARDFTKAAFWFRKAAYYGYSNAQYNLAILYIQGQGVERDYKQASYWMRKAAERGNPAAQLNLAGMYSDGEGVAKDNKQAMYWYCKSLARGDENARLNLQKIYPGGEGASDAELDYFCWMISNSKRMSYQNAWQGRDALVNKLTQEQRASAEQSFNIWKAKNSGPSVAR